MADTNLDDPERITLLTALKKALGDENVPTTVWASLWFSDIDKLKAALDQVQRNPVLGRFGLLNREADRNLVLLCEFVSFCTFLSVDLLMLCRDPTISRTGYSAANTYCISISFSTKPGNSTESIDFRWS
jgi:hypothetical protein